MCLDVLFLLCFIFKNNFNIRLASNSAPPLYFLKIITFFNYNKLSNKNPAKLTITFIYTVTTAAKETNAAI